MNPASTTDHSPTRLYTKNFLLLWVSNFFMTTCLGCFFLFPLYIKQHGGSESDIGILMGVITVSSILLRPWISQAVDRFGRKRSFFLGTLSFFILPFLYAIFEGDLSGFYIPLIILRVIHGMGIALCFTAAFTIIADIVPQERLNEGIGMFGVTGLVGVATGPTISEPIIKSFGFDGYFVAISIIAAISLLLQIPLPETMVKGQYRNETSSFLDVLKRKKILGVGVLTVFFGFALATQAGFVSPFAASIGLPNLSLYFIAYSVAAVVARVFGSSLADRIGEAKVIPGALVTIASGFLFLVIVDNSILLVISGLISGLGHGFLFPCLNTLMIRHEPKSIRGKINGVFTGSIDLGILIGSFVLGYVGEWFGYTLIFISTFSVLMVGFVFFYGFIRAVTGSVNGGYNEK